MKMPPMLLIVGPSGAGKTTISGFLNLRNGWSSIESYTTRAPRYDGEEGHTFITNDEFDRLTDLVAYTEFNGHRYGCTAQQVDDNQIYVVDVPGVETLLQNYKGNKEFLAIYLDVSQTECRSRMAQRGDISEKIEARLNNDAEMFMSAPERLTALLGGDNVLVIGEMSSTDVVLTIENYLYTKGYEWETI